MEPRRKGAPASRWLYAISYKVRHDVTVRREDTKHTAILTHSEAREWQQEAASSKYSIAGRRGVGEVEVQFAFSLRRAPDSNARTA